MKTILAATNNTEKLKEIVEILTDITICSFKQVNCNIEVQEDGQTFEQNALKKAKCIYQKTNMPCLADDSGIEIEEYQGWPGVNTARFLGEDKATNAYARQRNEYILEKMKQLPKSRRKVTYVTVLAYVDQDREILTKGILQGYIAQNPRGENGFGFDEIFELEDGRTLAELSQEEKNTISSRKMALEKIKSQIC